MKKNNMNRGIFILSCLLLANCSPTNIKNYKNSSIKKITTIYALVNITSNPQFDTSTFYNKNEKIIFHRQINDYLITFNYSINKSFVKNNTISKNANYDFFYRYKKASLFGDIKMLKWLQKKYKKNALLFVEISGVLADTNSKVHFFSNIYHLKNAKKANLKSINNATKMLN